MWACRPPRVSNVVTLYGRRPYSSCKRVIRFWMLEMRDRAVLLFVCSNQRPRLGWRYCSINQTPPVNLFSSGPVMPCGRTVRGGSLSTVIEGAAEAGEPFEPLAL